MTIEQRNTPFVVHTDGTKVMLYATVTIEVPTTGLTFLSFCVDEGQQRGKRVTWPLSAGHSPAAALNDFITYFARRFTDTVIRIGFNGVDQPPAPSESLPLYE